MIEQDPAKYDAKVQQELIYSFMYLFINTGLN
jgi:hypothetical protein